jgi:hypothetical protein
VDASQPAIGHQALRHAVNKAVGNFRLNAQCTARAPRMCFAKKIIVLFFHFIRFFFIFFQECYLPKQQRATLAALYVRRMNNIKVGANEISIYFKPLGRPHSFTPKKPQRVKIIPD